MFPIVRILRADAVDCHIQPRELRPLQARDGAENADLLGVAELRLEADHVP